MKRPIIPIFPCVLSVVALFIGCENSTHRLASSPVQESAGPRQSEAREPLSAIEKLIQQLGNDDWETRAKAHKTIEEVGAPAEPFLIKALHHSDPEVKFRARHILRNIIIKEARNCLDRIRTNEKYEYDFPGFTLNTDRTIGRIEFEWGSGHGFTLNAAQLLPEETIVVKLNPRRKPYRSKYPPDNVSFSILSGKCPKSLFDSISQLIVCLTEVNVKDKETGKNHIGCSSWMSSNDFYVKIIVYDSTNNKIKEISYVGYANSEKEAFYLPLEGMRDFFIRNYLGSTMLKESSVNTAIQDFLSRKVLENTNSAWWVKERYIQLAGVAGNKTVIPFLRKCLDEALETPSSIGGSPNRNRIPYYAMNALCRLTGKDFRPQPVDNSDITEAVQKYKDWIDKEVPEENQDK